MPSAGARREHPAHGAAGLLQRESPRGPARLRRSRRPGNAVSRRRVPGEGGRWLRVDPPCLSVSSFAIFCIWGCECVDGVVGDVARGVQGTDCARFLRLHGSSRSLVGKNRDPSLARPMAPRPALLFCFLPSSSLALSPPPPPLASGCGAPGATATLLAVFARQNGRARRS